MEFRELSLPIKIAILSSPLLFGGSLIYLDANYQNFPMEYIEGAFMLLSIVGFFGWLLFGKEVK